MKKLILLLLVSLSITVKAQSKVEQNIGDFTTLKVFNGIELELIKSSENKVVITGDKSEDVKIKNVDKTLKFSLPFSLNPEKNSANGEILIKLYYNSTLEVIDANEGATITGKNINQTKLEVKSQERALINLVVNIYETIHIKCSSGGVIKLTGSTKNQETVVDLYGVFHGFNLTTENDTNINAESGAKAEINSGKNLVAKVGFGGSIFYKGNPEKKEEKKVIGGIIQKRN